MPVSMPATRLLRHRHALAWALACALVLAQAFGLAHGVVHAPGLAAASVAADGHFDGHHAGDAECRLLDQLAHADALLLPAAVLPPLPPAPAEAARQPAGPATAFAAAYLARAPPRA